MDGSGFPGDHPVWRQGGWSLIKLDSQGEPFASMRGPVGAALPPNTSSGEHLGVAAATRYGTAIANIFTDYANLAGLDSRPREQALNPKSMHAGLRRSIMGAPGWSSQLQLLKVKAHQALDSLCLGSKEWTLAKGNEEADLLARHAAQTSCILPDGATQDEYVRCKRLLKKCLVFLGRALALWPTEGPSKGKKAHAPPTTSLNPPVGVASIVAEAAKGPSRLKEAPIHLGQVGVQGLDGPSHPPVPCEEEDILWDLGQGDFEGDEEAAMAMGLDVAEPPTLPALTPCSV